jgi:hypothetical protein
LSEEVIKSQQLLWPHVARPQFTGNKTRRTCGPLAIESRRGGAGDNLGAIKQAQQRIRIGPTDGGPVGRERFSNHIVGLRRTKRSLLVQFACRYLFREPKA